MNRIMQTFKLGPVPSGSSKMFQNLKYFFLNNKIPELNQLIHEIHNLT